ncbi:hypothetical protein BJ875DRAFT_480770 [Amylocarpus encephaloides]|uniref:Uncharacterized protein n=1 Tax=Amylocarpus encephaloides TaxID=45428 RepID=A0A9P8C911_9HELO|nr:hypothetical protein BJ875DRAFT_480770 [Amylocarpus encephaloides]
MDDSDEIETLKSENEALKCALKEATLQLAALAHKEYQVPDGSIRDDYEKRCRAIEIWIDYACSDQPNDFRNKYREALKNEDKTHRLETLGIGLQGPATSDPTLEWRKKLDTLHYYILSLTIGRYVFQEILMRPYPVGTTPSQESAFLSIEKEMLKMGKTKSKKNQWRSDTLRALCSSKSFHSRHQYELSRLWEPLQGDLTYWLKSGCLSKHKARLQREIFAPAVKLHREILFSTQQYEFNFITTRDLQFVPKVGLEEAIPYIGKDITTWKTMTDEFTYTNFQCIYPSLAAYDMEAENKSELVKPVVAVYKHNFPPVAKLSTASSASSSPQRTDSPLKESREYKLHKTTSTFRNTGNSWFEWASRGSRKAGDSRRSPESASRRAIRDSKSTQSRNRHMSQDQSINHPPPNQTPQNQEPQASSYKYSHPPTGETQQYEDITVEEPEEMQNSTYHDAYTEDIMVEEPEEMQNSTYHDAFPEAPENASSYETYADNQTGDSNQLKLCPNSQLEWRN